MSPDKRASILRAAEKVITGRRLHEVTIEEVAKAAHVSKGTIYTYFRDKEDLFFRLATEGFEELCELLKGHAPEKGEFRNRLLAICREISSFFVRRRPLMRVMIEHEGRSATFQREMRGRWKQKRSLLVDVVTGTLEAGVREGRVRADLPVRGLAELLLGMLRARGRRLAEKGQEQISLKEIIEVFLRGAGRTEKAKTGGGAAGRQARS